MEIKSGAAAKEEEITFKWYIEKQDENFNGTKECKTEIFRNGQLVSLIIFFFYFKWLWVQGVIKKLMV